MPEPSDRTRCFTTPRSVRAFVVLITALNFSTASGQASSQPRGCSQGLKASAVESLSRSFSQVRSAIFDLRSAALKEVSEAGAQAGSHSNSLLREANSQRDVGD